MRIYEIGLVKEGIPLVSVHYSSSGSGDIDDISKGALISSLISYAESVMSSVEYFESDKYAMIFKKGKMMTANSGLSSLLAFVIADRKRDISEKSKKRVIELLTTILDEFVKRYKGTDTSSIDQFEEFKPFITEILGDLTKSLDDKFSSLFS